MFDTWAQKEVQPQNKTIETLSKREMEVYLFIGEGYSFSEIADKLCLSPKTIESYISRLKVKLSLQSNRDVLRHAIDHIRQSKSL